jgi:hypothetical protein
MRYTIWYGWTGHFYECQVGRNAVVLYNVDSHSKWNESRADFARRLRNARNDKTVSIVRWE